MALNPYRFLRSSRVLAQHVLYSQSKLHRGGAEGSKNRMFLILFFVLLVLWVMGFLAFHVAGGLIHLLLILAVISIVAHLFRGRRTV
jgi:hypothetical protein